MNDRTCNRCNQPLVGQQKKYCSHLCANRDSRQAYSTATGSMPQKPCDVDGCEKPARSKTAELCKMHYHRVYRYGSLTPTHPPRFENITGKRYGTVTATVRLDGQKWLCQCDCGETRVVDLGNLNRYGDANTCGTKRNHLSDNADYGAAHSRLRAYRGPASKQRCIDCGAQARHWSYGHGDPDERLSKAEATLGIAYSLDPEHYDPRCVPCHKRFDLGRINATGVHGA